MKFCNSSFGEFIVYFEAAILEISAEAFVLGQEVVEGFSDLAFGRYRIVVLKCPLFHFIPKGSCFFLAKRVPIRG